MQPDGPLGRLEVAEAEETPIWSGYLEPRGITGAGWWTFGLSDPPLGTLERIEGAFRVTGLPEIERQIREPSIHSDQGSADKWALQEMKSLGLTMPHMPAGERRRRILRSQQPPD